MKSISQNDRKQKIFSMIENEMHLTEQFIYIFCKRKSTNFFVWWISLCGRKDDDMISQLVDISLDTST